MAAVELQDADFAYRSGGGIRGLTLSIDPGEFVSVFGGTGAGKSTVLRLLAGRLRPTSGNVRVRGRTPQGSSRYIGHAASETRLSPFFTPHQLMAQRMVRRAVPADQRAARMAEMLALFELYDDRDRAIRELSDGARTALRIALALVHRPSLLLLDNVTSAMPEPTAERLRLYLDSRRKRDERLTVIQGTTRSEEAEQCDRVVMLDRGCLLAVDAPDRLLARCAADALCVEAAEPEAVRSTLRGIFDVEITETPAGLRFRAADGTSAASSLLRNPVGGARAIYLRRPTLWDVLAELRG